jgi:hypothetical protein
MQPIPVKVKNVSVFAYFDPTMPLSEEILSGASGTYSVGTLIRSAFYNLDLDDEGKKENPLKIHGKYYAQGETESGDKFQTPWMYCLDNSDQPQFGRTITFGDPENEALNGVDFDVNPSQFIELSPLTNITVTQQFPPPAIGETLLIENGKGHVIATKTGTPHEMGVEVSSGDRVGKIAPGMKNIMVSGKIHLANGEVRTYVLSRLTAISGGEPAVFLQEFF